MMILSGAALAMAGPILNRDVDVVVEVVTQVVTEVIQYTVVATAPAEAEATTVEPTTTSLAPVIVTVTAEAQTPAAVEPTTTPLAPVVVTVTAGVETPAVDYKVAAVSTTSTSAAAVASSPTDFQSVALYHHNIHRANHSTADVTYSDTLAGFAATLSSRCVFEHDV